MGFPRKVIVRGRPRGSGFRRDRRRWTKLKSSLSTRIQYLLPILTIDEILLEEFLKPMELSQNALARAIGVPPRRINEIVLGKRAVTADTDLRLTC